MSLFILFGAMALGSAAAMILSRNAVHGALMLVVNLGSLALLFLTLNAEFLFVAQIIVYAGAIMVLFLFVIMLLGVDRKEVLTEPQPMQRRQIRLGAVLALVLAGFLFPVVVESSLFEKASALSPGFGSPESVGRSLFTSYLLPFEITSLLLVVAAVGIVVLAKRQAP